jgi:hypothetical protein
MEKCPMGFDAIEIKRTKYLPLNSITNMGISAKIGQNKYATTWDLRFTAGKPSVTI